MQRAVPSLKLSPNSDASPANLISGFIPITPSPRLENGPNRPPSKAISGEEINCPINISRRVHFQHEKESADNKPKRMYRSSPVPSIRFLCCMVCETPLGKMGMLVLLLGLVGMVLTQGTTLIYGAATLAITGAAALSISLFYKRRTAPQNATRYETSLDKRESVLPSF